jgi:tetratricopeptide (TPR) repeat protein
LFIIFIPALCSGEIRKIDSVYIEMIYAKGRAVWYTKPDSAVYYFNIVKDLAHTHNYKRGEANALKALGFFSLSNHERLRYYIKALDIRKSINDSLGIGISLGDIGGVYKSLRELEKMRSYYERSMKIRQKLNDHGGIAPILINLGQYEEDQGNLEKAHQFLFQGLEPSSSCRRTQWNFLCLSEPGACTP